MALGSGAAPDVDDRSEEGTISNVNKDKEGDYTIHRNHKIPSNDIDTLRIHEQLIITRINLRISSLNSIQGSLRTQRLPR
jgi:hypothetical protein